MEETEIAAAIAALAAEEGEARERAARAVYEAGCAAALDATGPWRADKELASLLIRRPTVGVAVRPESFERIRKAWGSPPLADVPAEHHAREFELGRGAGVSLDILTTEEGRGGGAIERFLARRGEGIQQVELPVADVERATVLVRERFALEAAYSEARRGADGTRVNFFLVTAGGGGKVLIELVEEGGKPDDPNSAI